MALGFGTAIGTTASHLLPHWSALSNPYPSLSLGAYSWAVMLAEIVVGLTLEFVGLEEERRQRAASALRSA